MIALCGTATWLSTPGSPAALLSWITIIQRTIIGGGIAALWLAGAVGLGVPFKRLFSSVDPNTTRALIITIGVGIMLTLAHGIGVLGGYSRAIGQPLAWTPVIIGAVLLLVHFQRRSVVQAPASAPLISPLILLGVIPAALLLVACCIPPGTLWNSEARAYDVLSYHLELPKEWLAEGRIAPLTHNVYSYLPSYVESAYAQLGAMFGHAGSSTPSEQLGFGHGWAIYAAGFLHAGLMVLAAISVGSLAASRCGRIAGWIAGLTLLAQPWVIVTGSLAYNEGAVLLMLVGALAAASATSLSALTRGALVGFLCAIAVSAKPTAMLMVTPAVIIALLAAPGGLKAAIRMFIGAAIVGAITLSPWLIRNALHGGNPLFPFAESLFGNAHWTAEQVSRWNGGHHAGLSIADRLSRLLSQEYGLRHPQWATTQYVALAALVFTLIRRDTHRRAATVGAMLIVQIIAWMSVGHLQSRFLLPIAVPVSLLVALAVSRHALNWHRAVIAPAALFVIGSSLFALAIFLRENGMRPNRALLTGVEGLNGVWFADDFHHATPEQQDELLELVGPDAAINLTLDPSTTQLLCVGDVTPLYLGVSTVYATTWDHSLLADAIRANPDDPDEWIASLRRAGVTHLLVNTSELDRLRTTGWLDPVLTAQNIKLLRDMLGPALRAWPERGQWLHRLGR